VKLGVGPATHASVTPLRDVFQTAAVAALAVGLTAPQRPRRWFQPTPTNVEATESAQGRVSVGARRLHREAGNRATRFIAASSVCAIRAVRMGKSGACRDVWPGLNPYSRRQRQGMGQSPISRRAEPDSRPCVESVASNSHQGNLLIGFYRSGGFTKGRRRQTTA
jgi:hypothetical protein